jgi:hypothetical protein
MSLIGASSVIWLSRLKESTGPNARWMLHHHTLPLRNIVRFCKVAAVEIQLQMICHDIGYRASGPALRAEGSIHRATKAGLAIASVGAIATKQSMGQSSQSSLIIHHANVGGWARWASVCFRCSMEGLKS